MKKKLLIPLCIAFLVLFTTTLSACEFSLGGGEPKTMSGSVILSSTHTGLSGISICTNTQVLAITQSDGSFSFTTTISPLTIYAKSTRYAFSPKQVTLLEAKNDILFSAETIQPVNGTLALKQIIIKPTNILSIEGENFLYQHNDKPCIKAETLDISVAGQNFSLLDSSCFLEEDKNKIIDITQFEPITTEDYTMVPLKYKLEAYYQNAYGEVLLTWPNYKITSLNMPITNADIDENSNLQVNSYGINSLGKNGYTFDITFIFELQP